MILLFRYECNFTAYKSFKFLEVRDFEIETKL